MIELLKAIVLGIIEGATEFIPVSSTGHLIVAAAFLNFQHSANGTFEIFIQLGAVIALVVFYFRRLWNQLMTVTKDKSVQRLWLGIIIAFIPAAAIGILIIDWLKAVLFNPITVAISLIVGGVIFLLLERRPKSEQPPTELKDISLKQAAIIGIAQVFSLIPGVSRSGASIVGGLLAGLSRQAATEFSFYLFIPTLGMATLYELVRNLDQLQSSDLGYMFVGMVVAAIVSWLSIRWLLNYVSRHTFVAFGYYRILAGVVILLLAAIGVSMQAV